MYSRSVLDLVQLRSSRHLVALQVLLVGQPASHPASQQAASQPASQPPSELASSQLEAGSSHKRLRVCESLAARAMA